MRRIWADMKSQAHLTNQGTHWQNAESGSPIRERLRTWMRECPRPLENTQEDWVTIGSNHWCLLSYHHAIILMHQPALVQHSRRKFIQDKAMSAIYAECAESAATLCKVYQDVYLGSPVTHTWGALHIVFLGGLTYIYCLWIDRDCRRKYRRDTVASTCTACLVVLVIMTERWAAAQPFRDMFQSLASITHTMLAEQDEKDAREPALPLPTGASNRLPEHLAGILGIGMCSSVEHVLGSMLQY